MDESAFLSEVDKLWQKYDRDSNGYLDQEEFLVFASENNKDFPKEDV